MDELDPRVRAICDLNVAEAREYGGRHEYDGVPQDLSPRAWRPGWPGWRRPGSPARRRTTRTTRRTCARSRSCSGWSTATCELHRRNPMFHLGELDLACYDKDYAPEAERDARPRRAPGRLAAGHRRGRRRRSTWCPRRWRARCSAASAGWRPASRRTPTPAARDAALAAHGRLVAHVERAAREATPDAALGRPRSPRCWSPPRRSTSTWARSPRGPTPSGTG